MIKARILLGGNKELIVLGLSHKSLDLLRESKPISFNLSEIDAGSAQVLIVAGETEEIIAAELTNRFGEPREVRGREKSGSS